MTDKQNRNLNILKSVIQAETELRNCNAMKLSDERKAEQFRNNFPFQCCTEEYNKCAKLSEEMMKRAAENYNNYYKRYMVVRDQAECAIDTLPDSQLREILRCRYLENMTMEDIADRLFFSVRTVKYKHAKALEMLDFT